MISFVTDEGRYEARIVDHARYPGHADFVELTFRRRLKRGFSTRAEHLGNIPAPLWHLVQRELVATPKQPASIAEFLFGEKLDGVGQ